MFRSARLVGMVLVAVLAVSACTKSDEATAPSVAPSVAAIDVRQGDYGWAAYGVTATLVPGPEAWTLDVTNTSGKKIDAPGIYALASNDGHEIDAKVEGSKPLADGASATLDVTWPADFDRKNVGMVMLLIGEDLYGGFERGR